MKERHNSIRMSLTSTKQYCVSIHLFLAREQRVIASMPDDIIATAAACIHDNEPKASDPIDPTTINGRAIPHNKEQYAEIPMD